MRKYLLWIVEVFIWVLILFVVSGALMFAKYNYKKQFNSYQIFLPDVDGLIVGSPVKIMGIQIGYVNQLDIVGEDVYVKFIVTDADVNIPSGSVATVEFSGLAGSKSLELNPPKSNKNPSNKFIIAQSPKRIHDSLGLLNQMFEQVVDMTYTCSRFMDKVGIIKKKNPIVKNGNPMTIQEVLDSSNKWLDGAQKQSDKFQDKLNKKKDKGDEQRQNQNN